MENIEKMVQEALDSTKSAHKRILTPGEMEQLTLRRADLPRELAEITIQVEEVAQ